MTFYYYRHVEIDFSLILDLNIGPSCRSLCNANEGILLRADSSISTAYLNFYYNKQNRGNDRGRRVPQLHFIDGGRVSLSYDNNVTFIKYQEHLMKPLDCRCIMYQVL